MGFCHSGAVEPWSGFTAQVNTTLKRPIATGSVLMLRATVDRVEGRKVIWRRGVGCGVWGMGYGVCDWLQVWVNCELLDPASGSIHCSGTGLYLKNKDSSSSSSSSSNSSSNSSSDA